MQARPMSSCGVCLSVRPSVTFVNSVKTSKHVFKFFSPLGRHTILVFPYQTSWQYSDENPLTGALNAGGVGIWLHCVLPALRPRSVKSKAATDGVELSTHGGIRRRCSHKTTTIVDEIFVTGSTLYAGDGGRTSPPGHNPLGHNSVFCCRRTW